jgi:ribosome biogenesis protein UTP30
MSQDEVVAVAAADSATNTTATTTTITTSTTTIEDTPQVAPENLSKNILKAISALFEHEKRKASSTSTTKKGKKNLLEESETENDGSVDKMAVYLTVAMKKIPEKPSLKPHRLSIPHPWRSAQSSSADLSICLITKDPHEEYKQRVRALNLPSIKKVMPLSKLRTNFKPFEAKRQLAASYDLFLADNRIVTLLPKLLGKKFFSAKKQPVVVDMGVADLEAELSSATAAALLFFASGPSSTIKIGIYKQGTEKLGENCEAIIKELVARVPGGWSGIKSLYIKTNQSISLPIY